MYALAHDAQSAQSTRIIDRAPQPDQRAHIRWSGEAAYGVRVHHGDCAVSCGLRDISAGGAALTGDLQVETGHVLVVEINDYLKLPGVVVRIQPDRIALQFVLTATLAGVIDRAIQLGFSPAQW